MYLSELLEVLNDNATVVLYDSNLETIGFYEGKNTIDCYYISYDNEKIRAADFKVSAIFPVRKRDLSCIGIELEMNVKDYKECRIF